MHDPESQFTPITATNLFLEVDSARRRSFSENHKTFLRPYHLSSVADELISTAQALVNPRGRGIYATDETPSVIEGLLGKKGASDVEKAKQRNLWRKAAYESIPSEYVSGVILYSDTLLDNPELVSILTMKGIIPGVRANGELASLPGSPQESLVEGLDNLLRRLRIAREAGARFSKWRVPIACTASTLPSEFSLDLQAQTLASFAAISQQAGLVPIVEPDVEFVADANLARSVEVHQKVIRKIFSRCLGCGVLLEGTLIKPSFPQPGLQHPDHGKVGAREIALATAAVVSNAVPSAVAGVVFLSGGLAPEVATEYLAELNALVNSSAHPSPFSRLPPLSFSFGRALQGDAMKHWINGDEEKMKESFEKRAKACFMAANLGAMTTWRLG